MKAQEIIVNFTADTSILMDYLNNLERLSATFPHAVDWLFADIERVERLISISYPRVEPGSVKVAYQPTDYLEGYVEALNNALEDIRRADTPLELRQPIK